MKPVVVVGSLNLDLVVRPDRAPEAGETLLAPKLERFPGGKGGNQAVAAARLATPVAMLGRVGLDEFGEQLVSSLLANGVVVEAVSRSATAGSGVALITVDQSGQNRIVVAQGANAEVTPDLLECYAELIRSASVVLLQLEIPTESCVRVAELAAEAGIRVILDPAPAPQQPLLERLRALTWLITPNEWEAFAGGVAAALARGIGLTGALRWGAAAGALAVTRPGAQPAMASFAEISSLLGLEG